MYDREHVISVVLSDEDWKAFLELHPQPVVWLRERIQETIQGRVQNATLTTTPDAQQDRRAARVAATV